MRVPEAFDQGTDGHLNPCCGKTWIELISAKLCCSKADRWRNGNRLPRRLIMLLGDTLMALRISSLLHSRDSLPLARRAEVARGESPDLGADLKDFRAAVHV